MAMRFVAWVVLMMCLVLPQGARSDVKTVTLAAETCSYVLTYNEKKARKQQLEDTFEFLMLPRWAETFGVSVFKAEDIEATPRVNVAQECQASLDKVKALQLVKLSGVESLRQTVLDRITDSCAFHTALQAGYRLPAALRSYAPATSCNRFVDALEDKSDLIAVFDAVVKDSCRNNVDEQACVHRQNRRRGNKVGMKIEVLNFGWNNCAVTFMKINRNQERDDATRRQLADVFLKQFKAKEVECEEP